MILSIIVRMFQIGLRSWITAQFLKEANVEYSFDISVDGLTKKLRVVAGYIETDGPSYWDL